ncbi:MAG: hypothetical protein ACFE85_03140 [Candidatus Hodarchaeota archaeon]
MYDYDHYGMNHMFDWGTSGLIFIILGFIVFALIALILLYLLSQRKSSKEYNEKVSESIETQNSQRTTTNEEIINIEKPYFCPNCGVKLDNNRQKYCLLCGTKL